MSVKKDDDEMDAYCFGRKLFAYVCMCTVSSNSRQASSHCNFFFLLLFYDLSPSLSVFLSLTSLDLIRPLYMYVYASPSLLYADHRLSYYLYIRERERNSVEVKVKTQCSGAASSSSLVSSSLCFFFIVCMHFICTCTCVYTRALHITSFFCVWLKPPSSCSLPTTKEAQKTN